MARPKNAVQSASVTLRLPSDLLGLIDAYAESNGVSRSSAMVALFRTALGGELPTLEPRPMAEPPAKAGPVEISRPVKPSDYAGLQLGPTRRRAGALLKVGKLKP